MAIQQAVRKQPEKEQRRKKRRLSDYPNGKSGPGWSLLSPQGRVLFYIAACPDAPVEEIARNLDLTERAVWGVVRALRQEGMIHLRKRGRRHFYLINLDAPLLHPTIRGLTLRPILSKVALHSKRERPEVCD